MGEAVSVSDEKGWVFACEIEAFQADSTILRIIVASEGKNELQAKITLYQGLPKSDKMELIIQKAVELGAVRIVPVEMKRTIVKVEPKKEASRNQRYQAIAESAAKQSGRDIIPEVSHLMTMKEAIADAKELQHILVPYECAMNMEETRALLASIQRTDSIGIFIGPEGGFEPSEVEAIEAAGGKRITLGRRILRTETAGLCILSALMMQLD